MTTTRHVSEGYIPYRGYRTWYRIVGVDGLQSKTALLCLHGGPGAPHFYLEPLERAADENRPVILYDQIGCGNSDQPSDPTLWTVDLFVEEIDAVREALGLERIHLFGMSWGGMLALEYAVRKPPGLVSIVIAHGIPSFPLWASENARLLAETPEASRRALEEHSRADTTDHPDYQAAIHEFYRRHVCRLDEWPDYLSRTLDNIRTEITDVMVGSGNFNITGTLKNWDITPRLGEIEVPTLVMSGRYDMATPVIAESIHRGIPGSEWMLFEESSHTAFIEEPELFLQVLQRFLDKAEEQQVT